MHTDYEVATIDRLSALAGLAVCKSGKKGACLQNEQLAAFIDGQVDAQTRERILAHLNRCGTCRERWLEIDAYMQRLKTIGARASRWSHWSNWTRWSHWSWSNCGSFMSGLLAPKQMAIASFAVLALVGIAIWWLVEPDIGGQIDQLYTDVRNEVMNSDGITSV